jgi:hypothetical protein
VSYIAWLISRIGSYVFLSRTNPCVDPVLEDGTIRTPSEEEEAEEAEINPTEWLRAKVYSRAKHYVRIQLPNPVQGMGTGRWRYAFSIVEGYLPKADQQIGFGNVGLVPPGPAPSYQSPAQ